VCASASGCSSGRLTQLSQANSQANSRRSPIAGHCHCPSFIDLSRLQHSCPPSHSHHTHTHTHTHTSPSLTHLHPPSQHTHHPFLIISTHNTWCPLPISCHLCRISCRLTAHVHNTHTFPALNLTCTCTQLHASMQNDR
jgi:hypothetical protein